MDKRYARIMVDGNNLFEKHYHRVTSSVMGDGAMKLIIGGFLQSIVKLDREYLSESGTIYILFDNTSSKETQRKDIDPEYKLNRIKRDPEFYRGLDFLQLILLNFKDNYVLVYRSHYEADDLTKPLLLMLPKHDHVLMVSEDRDWARLIEYDGRVVHWLAKDRVFTSVDYEAEYGYKPTEKSITIEKAIRGDDSDNIPVGLPNLKSSILKRVVVECDDIYDFIDTASTYLSPKMLSKLSEHQSRLILNYQLVDFMVVSREQMEEFIYPCQFKPSVLKPLYETAVGDSFVDERLNELTPKRESGKFFQPIRLKR